VAREASMCMDSKTAITGGDELRCTKRRERAMCVYSACKLGEHPAGIRRLLRADKYRASGGNVVFELQGRGIVQNGQ
jgi:hypothetical protein